jgi:uncharacterized membrane protein
MWIIYAVLNPISESFRNVFSKKASKEADPLLISWFNNLIPVIVYLPVLFLVDLKFSFEFFYSILGSGIINIAAVLLYHRAIAKGDISLVVPMLSFTPLFLLITSPLLIGEFPDLYGLLGIVLIVFGSYLLNINLAHGSIFHPLKSLLKNKGTRYMLIVSFIWSISANFDKIGIQASSTFQYIIFINMFVFMGITIFLFAKGKYKTEQIAKAKTNLILVGFFTAFGFFLQMTALSLTLVAYVIAIKRTSGMLTVLHGHLFFGEKHIKERMLGSVIMFIGVLLIILPW